MPEMQYRFLGRTGLKVSVISLGSWITYGGHVSDEQAFESFKTAYDAGVNFFDTAENYNAGAAEVVLGKAIKHFGWRQNDLVISTKVGMKHGDWSSIHGGTNVRIDLSRSGELSAPRTTPQQQGIIAQTYHRRS